MQLKSAERSEAIKLRKEGYSLGEISGLLRISKSTASVWLCDIQLSEIAQRKILRKRVDARLRANQTNRARTDQKMSSALQYGHSVVESLVLTPNASRLLFAMLYWCEGVKIRRGNTFAFTNSDPLLVETFMRLFRQGFAINEKKLRLSLHVHDYHDVNTQLQFWSKVTTIPLTQCHKPYRKPHTAERTREGYQGCVSIRYSDVHLARQIEGIAIAFLQKKGL